MVNVSVVIITLNEEAVIRRAIESVLPFCKEVVVVDSGSTDKTVEILKSYDRVKVFFNKFEGYATQKNYGISKAEFEWVFVLDADEFVDSMLQDFIANTSLESNCIYCMNRKNWLWGGWLSDSVGSDLQERLFKKNDVFYKSEIHEKLDAPSYLRKSANGNILHKPHSVSAKSIFEKQLKYTELEACDFGELSKPLLWLVLRPFARFFWTYIIRRGFLDGKRGLAWAFVTVTYDCVTAVKVMEKKYSWLEKESEPFNNDLKENGFNDK